MTQAPDEKTTYCTVINITNAPSMHRHYDQALPTVTVSYVDGASIGRIELDDGVHVPVVVALNARSLSALRGNPETLKLFSPRKVDTMVNHLMRHCDTGEDDTQSSVAYMSEQITKLARRAAKMPRADEASTSQTAVLMPITTA